MRDEAKCYVPKPTGAKPHSLEQRLRRSSTRGNRRGTEHEQRIACCDPGTVRLPGFRIRSADPTLLIVTHDLPGNHVMFSSLYQNETPMLEASSGECTAWCQRAGTNIASPS